jgi:hypothetical protein
MGQRGQGRCADRTGDPLGLLARFDPAVDVSARVVLHPRLTFVACPTAVQHELARSFRVGVDARIVRAADLTAGGPAPGRRAAEVALRLREVRTAVATLGSERTTLEQGLAQPDAVQELRAALFEYEMRVWKSQAGQPDPGTAHRGEGAERLVAALVSAGASGDEAPEDVARRWLADRELASHYTRQHLDAISGRIEELERIERALTGHLDDASEHPPRDVGALARWLVTGAPEPLVVLVEIVDPATPGLVAAMVAASELRRVVYATAEPSLLREASALETDVGATRDVLVTERPTALV